MQGFYFKILKDFLAADRQMSMASVHGNMQSSFKLAIPWHWSECEAHIDLIDSMHVWLWQSKDRWCDRCLANLEIHRKCMQRASYQLLMLVSNLFLIAPVCKQVCFIGHVHKAQNCLFECWLSLEADLLPDWVPHSNCKFSHGPVVSDSGCLDHKQISAQRIVINPCTVLIDSWLTCTGSRCIGVFRMFMFYGWTVIYITS